MDAATETTVYERTFSIDASPDTVWEFFVDPEKARRWMGIDMELEAQRGGSYRCEVIPGHTARGEFVELDEPNRLVFTWGWDGSDQLPPGASTIEVELASDGEGTNVRFVHHLPSAEQAASHKSGWDHYLPRLETAAAGGDPGEDPWVTNPPGM
ncbi:MAG: SRPBCC domain-containing protein [Gaiellaceae bacterium]